MTPFEGPRPATRAEIPGLLSFLERIFPEITTRYRHLYGRAHDNPGWFHVITYKGRLAANIGIFPMEFMLPGGGKVVAGGIGAVATDPKFRGKGLMGALLNYSTNWMAAQGMPISILWGNRRRYARFGWEPAGVHMGWRLEKEGLPLLDRFRLPVRPLKDPKSAGPALAKLHLRSGVGIKPDPAHFHLMLSRKGRRAFVAGPAGRPEAYVLQNGEGKNWSVEAMAGSTRGIFSIFRKLGELKGVAPLIYRKDWNLFYDAIEGWSSSITGIGQVKVIDLKGLLKAYGLARLEPGIKALRLSPMQLPRLLFGPIPPQALLPAGPRLKKLAPHLPLPLFLWPAETV